MQMLINKGVNVNATDKAGKTALMYVSSNSRTVAAETAMLLKAGANVKARDKDGKTALMYASSAAQAALLLKAGVDVNAKDHYGRTAFLHASDIHDLGLIKLLLSKGLDINARDNYGTTALMNVCCENNQERNESKVKWLLQHGANVLLKNKEGKTALDYAKLDKLTSIIPLLKQAAARK